jgi:hypothetical protein
MRGTIKVLLLALFCSAGHFAMAQCASSQSPTQVQCTPTCQGLMQTVSVGQFGVPFDCFTYSCCGQNLPYCYLANGTCGFSGKLNDPAIRQRLYELAKTQDVMIASCDGNYRPLVPLVTVTPELFRDRHTLPGITGGGQ